MVKASEPVDLRLPSLGGALPRADERRYQLEEAHRLRVERSRRNIQNVRAVYLGEVGQTCLAVASAARYRAEREAQYVPEERAGLDMIAAAVETGCANIIGEMAR
jgi:hypothetical protein